MIDMRLLSQEESKLVAAFANRLEIGERQQLLDDLECATVIKAASDGSRLIFDLARHERPAQTARHPFAVKGKMLDRDGAVLSVVLYADDHGRLLELEFVRSDARKLAGPQWKTFELNQS